MSDEKPEPQAITELIKLVRKLEQRVIDLTDEVQSLRSQHDKSTRRSRKRARQSSAEMWDELSSLPLRELPGWLREGDHWDLLWRDEPEDHFEDDYQDDDPYPDPDLDQSDDDQDRDDSGDDDGGSRVPAKPYDLPPDRSGGIALPLPREKRSVLWTEPQPETWYVKESTQALDGLGQPRV